MGKKSKKKGGAATKAARKERLQERREQQLEEVDNNHNQVSNSTDIFFRQYFEGDRVWFYPDDKLWGEGNNPNNYRGIVKSAIRSDALDIIPLQSMIDGHDRSVRVSLIDDENRPNVFPDFCDLTLRFDVGDEVLCFIDEQWQPETVTFLWPIAEIQRQDYDIPDKPDVDVPCYKCGEVAAPYDDDTCIMKHPSSFRFNVGDKVTFICKLSSAAKAMWVSGIVEAVDVTGRKQYAVYKCSAQIDGKQYSYYVTKDNDERIAKEGAEPRERLFDAIEQDCHRSHLMYLVNHYKIDVSTFRDLIVSEAIKNASYEALCWLQHDCGFDVLQMKDDHGNNLLHRIASSKKATQFIREAGRIDNMEDPPEWKIDLSDHSAKLVNTQNNNGETWLQILVKRGDVKALDAAFSPQCGLAWDVSWYSLSEEGLTLLEKSVKESGSVPMQCIFDGFVAFRTLHQQYRAINHIYSRDKEEALLKNEKISMHLFTGKDSLENAKRLARFVNDWQGCTKHLTNNDRFLTNLVTYGYPRLFELFFQADESMFFHNNYNLSSKQDGKEFIQPELTADYEGFDKDVYFRGVDIWTACMIGSDPNHYRCTYKDRSERRSYLESIQRYVLQCDPKHFSLQTHLQDSIQRFKSFGSDKRIHEKRICLLGDDKNLEGRLQIMDYLLQHFPNKVKLDAVEAIRHRQCGVVRFMVDKGLLMLNDNASSNRLFTKHASKLKCIERGSILSSITTGCFLSFVAIEFDDLQSLQWLCESSGVTTEMCDGFNLLHFSAFMGRVEATTWLYNQPYWQTLVTAVSKRKPFQQAYAVHIAANEGHIFLADFLLTLKYHYEHEKKPMNVWSIDLLSIQTKDTKGKLPEGYAKKSAHEFVREWAAAREKPLVLERHIKKLLQLLRSAETPVDKVKQFIITSKCLEPETWNKCKYFSIDEKPSFGISFGEVLCECCSKCPNADFVDWLCIRLYLMNDGYSCYSFFSSYLENEHTEKQRQSLSYDNLVVFATENGYDDIIDSLSRGRRWCNDITCVDPVSLNLLLKTALSGKPQTRVRVKLLHASILVNIAQSSDDEVVSIFKRCGQSDELDEIIKIGTRAKQSLIDGGFSKSGFRSQGLYGGGMDIDRIVKSLDMSSYVGVDYPENHPLRKHIVFQRKCLAELSTAHVFLATEGSSELLNYCLRNLQGWTHQMELEVVRIASFFGHTNIVDMFLDFDNALSLLDQRQNCAMCGAGEACRYRDLVQMVSRFGAPEDPALSQVMTLDDLKDSSQYEYEQRNAKLIQFVSESLLCSVLNGYLMTFKQDSGSENGLKALKFLVDKLGYTHDNIIFALEALWDNCFGLSCGSFFDMFRNIMDAIDLQPFVHHEKMRSLCKTIVETFNINVSGDNEEEKAETESRGLEWLDGMAEMGIDIQQLIRDRFASTPMSGAFEFPLKLKKIEEKQLGLWSTFSIVKERESLEKIQTAVEKGALSLQARDRGGLLVTHISAAYNRLDLLEWLVETKGMSLESLDGQSRTVLDVAKASKAAQSTKWIIEFQARRTIASFMQRNYHGLIAARKQQREFKATTLIQTMYRGYIIRRLYSGILSHRLEESQRFSTIWGDVIDQSKNINLIKESLNWSSIRERVFDCNQEVEFTYDSSYFEDTDEQLSKALEGALKVDDDGDDNGKTLLAGDTQVQSNEEVLITDAHTPNISAGSVASEVSWLDFQMTSHVVKFLKQGDPKYKSFFVRRMQQLGSGERSRILQKRLKGSQSTIYETYLEQKSGFRILWTEEGDSTVIWFVAKHKEVSRLMQLIDDSKSRTTRQQLSESVISDLRNDNLLPSQTEAKKEVLLDVTGNVPLKLYDVNFHTINDISSESWSPRLHLTDEERDVVEADGTVLVLGRSGTGKTICICNRMERDWELYGHDLSFSQLFVARSKRLCQYVSKVTGNHDTNSFQTFEELVNDLDTMLPSLEGSDKSFFRSQRVSFKRFKLEFHCTRSSKEKKVGALTLWTVIRTFIKGSIEAFKNPDGVLPIDDFIRVETLGKNRCRVPAELRATLYDEYLSYEEYKNKHGLWDDIDRINHILSRLDKCKNTNPELFDALRKSKIYVDEVQDYTQKELLLFFYLAGPGGLFLAGDPAQSVMLGTEFRFEEIRSVGYHVAESSGRDLIPNKAKTVNVNFRSHAGILDCAGAFLDVLFKYFPGCAKQLKKDNGLFQGSRPGVLHKVDVTRLATLLSDKLNGTIVLVHDESADYWRKALGDYKLVYGIREAKGLEFKSVMILNFFQELPTNLQKPWRNLLLDREGEDFESKYPLVGSQLKLLYTGITRCIERLFFAETSSSIAAGAAMRWLTMTKPSALATKNNINDIEAMAMTSDEFLSEGFKNAEQAELEEDIDLAYIALDRAVWCFEQAGNLQLASKARTNRLGVRFRRDLANVGSDKEMAQVKGAQLVESLIFEGLLDEVMAVFYSISPFMGEYAKEQLEKLLISKVRQALA